MHFSLWVLKVKKHTYFVVLVIYFGLLAMSEKKEVLT